MIALRPRTRHHGGHGAAVGGALVTAIVLTSFSSACDPEVTVGEWPCGRATLEQANAEAGAPGTSVPIEAPWSTSFEAGFCEYTAARGFCYADADTTDGNADAWYRITAEKAHSGRVSAAFHVNTDGEGRQSRCVREGILPTEAYYGAWFWVPSVESAANWNLMHFRGGDDLHGLWDVSLGRNSSGGLYLYVYDFLHTTQRMRDGNRLVPIGSWFHVQFFLRRAADDTGEIALYQDGQLLLRRTNIATDDSSWGQWYVGSLARTLSPPDAIVYVDDVTIDTKL